MTEKLKIFLLVLGLTFLSIPSLCGENYGNLKWQQKKSDLKLQKSIFISQSDESYFYYNVYLSKGKIIVKILDKDLESYSLTFQRPNDLQFRDAYDRFIIIEEVKDKKSVSFWVLKIIRTKKGFALEFFAVDSIQDSDGFKFNNAYTLTEIIEYDEIEKLLYVIMDSKSDYNVYKINLATKKSTKLEIVGWFFYSQKRKETIVGGNSQVLVEATNDQFWIDTHNKITINKPTIYNKVNIEDLTKLKIYVSGSQAYNFIGSYFQYVSVSKDRLNMSTFVYSGYTKAFSVAQGSLSSTKKPIKFWSDDETYFVAVSDNDVYFTLVYWNETIKDYTVYSSTLKKTVADNKKWPDYIRSFSQAVLIVLWDFKFFILTQDTFYVENGLFIEQFKLKKRLTDKQEDLQQIMFEYMMKYEKKQTKPKHHIKHWYN